MKLNYSEEVLTTSNTKLAATLLAFGATLRQHNPTFIAEEYKYSELKRGFYKRDGKDYPGKDPKPPERVFFNFNRSDAASAIAQAFESEKADTEFRDFITEKIAGLIPPDDLAKLFALHSAAVAQGCREVQQKREYLLAVIKATPKEARWVVVRRSQTSYSVFPKSAGPATVAQLIGKL